MQPRLDAKAHGLAWSKPLAYFVTGGLRKLRWAAANRGKRSGLRTIYYWAVDEETCFMLYIYSKAEQGNLRPAQLRAMARAVREEFK